jgi:hypothetical protein
MRLNSGAKASFELAELIPLTGKCWFEVRGQWLGVNSNATNTHFRLATKIQPNIEITLPIYTNLQMNLQLFNWYFSVKQPPLCLCLVVSS